MLTVVSSDGTTVNIVRRGSDIVVDDVRYVTVVDDRGDSYAVSFVQEAEPTGVNALLAVEGRVLVAKPFNNVVTNKRITAFSSLDPSEQNYPEVIEWLMQNYALTFSPAGLRVYIDGGISDSVINSAACQTSSGIFIFQTADEDEGLIFPADSSNMLGCDGASVPVGMAPISQIPSAPLLDIRDDDNAIFAYNTWLFYLASGLPRETFGD